MNHRICTNYTLKIRKILSLHLLDKSSWGQKTCRKTERITQTLLANEITTAEVSTSEKCIIEVSTDEISAIETSDSEVSATEMSAAEKSAA